MLVVVPALFRSIVVRNMTGSATRFTAGVQGRSLLSKVRVNGAWTQMSMLVFILASIG